MWEKHSERGRGRATGKRKIKGFNYANKIKHNIPVGKLFEYYKIRNVSKSGLYLNGSCPLPNHGGPDDHPSFGMLDNIGSSENGRFKCFSCGGGDMISFVQKMEGCNFKDAVNFLRRFSGVKDPFSMGVLEKEIGELEETHRHRETEEIIAKTYLPFIHRDMALVARYMVENNSRNFSPEKVFALIRDFKIGFSYYRGLFRIIIPINDAEGSRVTFFAQNPEDNEDKLYPKKAPTGRVLFALDKFKDVYKSIILVEGIWDALKVMSFGFQAIASFTSMLSEEQASLITEGFSIVYISYDNDKGGNKGFERAMELLFPLVQIRRVILPEDKDPCDCTEKEFKRALKRAKTVEYTEENYL